MSTMSAETPSEEPAPKTEPGETPKEKVNWWHELRGLALMLLAVLAFHTFVAKPFHIPSGSMMPGLLVGEMMGGMFDPTPGWGGDPGWSGDPGNGDFGDGDFGGGDFGGGDFGDSGGGDFGGGDFGGGDF